MPGLKRCCRNLDSSDLDSAKQTVQDFTFPSSKGDIFYNLCFAILAPQTTFVNNRKVIAELRKKKFFKRDIPKEELEVIVRPTRFYRNKSKYLLEAKRAFSNILVVLQSGKTGVEMREWLVKNIKGLGMKASSHFLRNLGIRDIAIIDTHVMKFLGYTHSSPRDKHEYLTMERQIIKIAEQNDVSVAVLDAYIWKRYSGTDWSDFDY